MKLGFYQHIKNKVHGIVPDGMMVNWDGFSKSLLILLLSAINQISWLIWCVYSYLLPQYSEWINQDRMQLRIIELCITIFFTFAYLIGMYKFRHNSFLKRIAPLFTIVIFTILCIHATYTIGISSPATATGYVCIVSLGFLFIERKYIYIVIIPATITLLSLIYLSLMKKIPYAPLFSEQLTASNVYKNGYWVVSMVYLYLPILVVCMGLIAILLSQWRNREYEIKILSEKDGLTNVYNRRSIAEKLSKLDQHELSYAVILLDLDYFKTVNDTYGHDAGDCVLKKVAIILAQNIRKNDMVGRFGGEEFILILNEYTLSFATEVAERCRQEIEKIEITIPEGTRIKVTASFGIAISNQIDTHEKTIRLADQALYLAKSNGRNQIRNYLEITPNYNDYITSV